MGLGEHVQWAQGFPLEVRALGVNVPAQQWDSTYRSRTGHLRVGRTVNVMLFFTTILKVEVSSPRVLFTL